MSQSPGENKQRASALLGFARIVRSQGGTVRIKFLWGRIFAALLVLGIAAWFAAAGALYYFFKHRHGFEEVQYSKMLVLPFRLDQHRKEMGDYHVQEGLQAMEDRNFRSALHLLRVGVARSKANREGRLALAQIFNSALQRPDWAADILQAGLNYGSEDESFFEVDYLRALFSLLLSNQYDERVIELADELLPQLTEGSPAHSLTAFAVARANIFVGNYQDAERILDQFNLTNSPQGQNLLADIRWNRGQREQAIEILHDALQSYPNQDALYSNLMRFYRDLEEWDMVRRFALLRSLRFPDKVLPRVDLLHALDATGEEEQILPNVEEILTEYPPEDSVLPLARFAAETGRTEIARIAYDLALENDFYIAPFTLLLQEALLRGGDFQASLDFSDELREEKPEWLEPRQALESGLRALALQGVGRSLDAEIFVREFMKSDRIRPETHVLVADLFEEKGASELAHSILKQSYERFPGNQLVLAALIQSDIQFGDGREFIANLRDLLRKRVPDAEILEKSAKELGSDRHLFLSDREDLLLRIEDLLPSPS